MAEHGEYEIKKFTRARRMISDAVTMSKYFHHIIGIFEIDVTLGLKIIDTHREKTGERLSITAWMMKCIAQAISEYPVIQAFRKGRRKAIYFKDVDLKVPVEKNVNGRKVPIAYVVRKANEKSFREIHDEIRAAQVYQEDQRKEEARIKRMQDLLMRIPQFFRRNIVWRAVMTDPFKMKKQFGTAGVTSMGMFGKGIVGWAVPKTMHTTTFALGAIVRKPVVREGEIVIRDIMHVTSEFNHETVDGSPAVRFVARLTELANEAFGLEEYKEMYNL